MEPGVVLLMALVGLLVIVVPILAISAFVRVRRFEQDNKSPTTLQNDLQRLELRVQGIEKALGRLYEERTSAPANSPAPSYSPAAVTAPPPAIRADVTSIQPPVAPVSSLTPSSISTAQSAPNPPARVFRESPISQPTNVLPQDFENVVAGKWLNYVGIVAILFAAAFFIEYAFENNWIGPRGRIAIGMLCGAALLGASGFLVRRGYEYFSEGIAALGAAVLYLSLWGAWHTYHIFDSSQVFAGMIVVTVVITVIALGRNSQRLALLALIGGFLTPMLCSKGENHELVLFTYTTILSAGMLALERFRQWTWLPLPAFAATQLYFWGWYSEFYTSEQLVRTMIFVVVFFVLFAALPVMRARRELRLNDAEFIVTVLNVAALLIALREMLWPDNRWTLTVAFLTVAVLHLFVLKMLPTPSTNTDSRGARVQMLFAGLALLCISLAIPARVDHQWLTIAWAAEGLLLVWSGVRILSAWLRGAGLFLFAVAAMRLLVLTIPAHTLLWNQRFMTYMIAVACFALACIFVRQIAPHFGEPERNAFAVLAIAVNVYALIALSLEIWDYFGRAQGLGIENWLAQQLGLTVLWTIYATALILTGMARRLAILRWQALTLFGVVVLKVFFYDLSTLSRFYRIVSFLVLGVLLLGVSFLYQRRALRHKERAL